jgi:hypothetical protein
MEKKEKWRETMSLRNCFQGNGLLTADCRYILPETQTFKHLEAKKIFIMKKFLQAQAPINN